jgi:hypothetical protein
MSYIDELMERLGRGDDPRDARLGDRVKASGDAQLLIRLARDGDSVRLEELAQLDSARRCAGRL